MTDEVKTDGHAITHSLPDLVVDSSGVSVGALTDGDPPRRSLFAMLDTKSQQLVVIFTYIFSVFLGCSLAVVSYFFEFYAQTHHLPFEMRDWMIAVIMTLLALPTLGTIVVVKKKLND